MHSFERKLSPLSNGVSGKVVQRIGRELFDLKARGDIFLITLPGVNCAISGYIINKIIGQCMLDLYFNEKCC